MTDLARLTDVLAAVLANVRYQEAILLPSRDRQIKRLRGAVNNLEQATTLIDRETPQRSYNCAAEIAAHAIHLMLIEREDL